MDERVVTILTLVCVFVLPSTEKVRGECCL